MIEKDPARRRKLYSARASSKQRDANLVLQITNLPAERRLRRVQPFFRRKFETARFSDRNEITKMPKFHRSRSNRFFRSNSRSFVSIRGFFCAFCVCSRLLNLSASPAPI